MAKERAVQQRPETPEGEVQSQGMVEVKFKKTMANENGIYRENEIHKLDGNLVKVLIKAGVVEVI